MVQQVMPFVMKHWALCGAFLLAFILVVIEEVRAQGPSTGRLTPSQAVQLINRDDALVIDVRDAKTFREGHIVNAKNIPLVDLDRGIEKINRARVIILVDKMGEKSSALVERVKKAGFEKVHVIKNGMDGWKAAELPIVKK